MLNQGYFIIGLVSTNCLEGIFDVILIYLFFFISLSQIDNNGEDENYNMEYVLINHKWYEV
jgi:hypothetical protein